MGAGVMPLLGVGSRNQVSFKITKIDRTLKVKSGLLFEVIYSGLIYQWVSLKLKLLFSK